MAKRITLRLGSSQLIALPKFHTIIWAPGAEASVEFHRHSASHKSHPLRRTSNRSESLSMTETGRNMTSFAAGGFAKGSKKTGLLTKAVRWPSCHMMPQGPLWILGTRPILLSSICPSSPGETWLPAQPLCGGAREKGRFQLQQRHLRRLTSADLRAAHEVVGTDGRWPFLPQRTYSHVNCRWKT